MLKIDRVDKDSIDINCECGQLWIIAKSAIPANGLIKKCSGCGKKFEVKEVYTVNITEVNEGTLRAWWIINPPSEPVYVTVKSPEEASKVINEEANRQLKNPLITDNAFGLEVYEDGEWCDWCDENGDNIDEFIDNLPA